MKQVFCFFLAWCFCAGAMAQPEQTVSGSTTVYLFPEFVPGWVQFKKGDRHAALLNYQMQTHEIVFLQNNKPMALAMTETVDTVFIKDGRFIPFHETFMEMLSKGPVSLLVTHSCKLVPSGKPGGNNSSSKPPVANGGPITYALKVPDNYLVLPVKEFYLQQSGDPVKALSSKQFTKLFKSKEKVIENYIKTNDVHFDRIDDMKKLMLFCNTSN
jgi:hypothetical protein